MAKTKDRVYDAAGSAKPYIERAMKDEKLREDVLSAFATAKDLYNELIGGRGAVTLATRVATDDEIREKLREAIDDLRRARDRSSDFGSRPSADEMSAIESRNAPGCGAGMLPGTPDNHAPAIGNSRSRRRFQASRYGGGFTAPS